MEVAEEIEHTLMVADDDVATLNDEVPSMAAEKEEGSAPPPPPPRNKETMACINWGKSPHCKMLMEALNACDN